MIKRIFFVFILFCLRISIYSQDIITLKNGEEIKAKVEEISSMEIRYKRFENLQGPTIVITKADVFFINYENGTREIITPLDEILEPKATKIPETKAEEIEKAKVEKVEKERAEKVERKREKMIENVRAKPNFGIFFNPGGGLTYGVMVGIEVSVG